MISIEKNYPKIKNLVKNSYYCGILKNLYAGSEGASIMFLQFQYQVSLLADFHKDLSLLLKEILETEIIHIEYLAHAILMTGGDPTYSNSQNVWISGRNVDYLKDVRQIISYDIELKEKSVIDYKIAISKIENQEVRNLLLKILQDEEIHLKNLKTFENNLFPTDIN